MKGHVGRPRLGVEELNVQTLRGLHQTQNAVEHYPGIENARDETCEVSPSLLNRVVRLYSRVDRARQDKNRRRTVILGQPNKSRPDKRILVACAVEGAPDSGVCAEVDPHPRGPVQRSLCIEEGKIRVSVCRGGEGSVRGDVADMVIENPINRRGVLVGGTVFARYAGKP